MSLSIPPGYGLAAWHWNSTLGTAPFVVTCGVDLTAHTLTPVTAANACMAAMAKNLGPVLQNTLTLTKCVMTVGVDGPGGSVDSNMSAIPMGRTASNPEPVAMAAVIRKNTERLGRTGRGRMFLPGALTESEVGQDGAITTARAEVIQTGVSGLLVDLETGFTFDVSTYDPAPMVLLHAPRAVPILPTPLESLTVQPLVGWVRGRIR